MRGQCLTYHGEKVSKTKLLVRDSTLQGHTQIPMGEWSVIGKLRQEPGTSPNTVGRSGEGCPSGPTDIWGLVAKDRHGAPK